MGNQKNNIIARVTKSRAHTRSTRKKSRFMASQCRDGYITILEIITHSARPYTSHTITHTYIARIDKVENEYWASIINGIISLGCQRCD